MDRKFFSISSLKEQQKRCPDCHSELYAIQDRKFSNGAKIGKAQDRLLFYKPREKGQTMLKLGNNMDDGEEDSSLIERDRLAPDRKHFSKIKSLRKRYIYAPESRCIVLECPACRYYCFVYEKTSVY